MSDVLLLNVLIQPHQVIVCNRLRVKFLVYLFQSLFCLILLLPQHLSESLLPFLSFHFKLSVIIQISLLFILHLRLVMREIVMQIFLSSLVNLKSLGMIKYFS